ncbi:MAG TPA: hypothetical protein VIT65_02670, partial [Microlunatus sp.]
EDPVAVRRSKAIGIIAYQARLRNLLARHADQPDPQPTPEERVAAHQADPTDPWAADLPTAGWETDRHGIVHQPSFDDLGGDIDEDCWTTQQPSPDEDPGVEEPPVDDVDLAWHRRQGDDQMVGGDHRVPDEHDDDVAPAAAADPSTTSAPTIPVPAAFTRGLGVPRSICGRSPGPRRWGAGRGS